MEEKLRPIVCRICHEAMEVDCVFKGHEIDCDGASDAIKQIEQAFREAGWRDCSKCRIVKRIRKEQEYEEEQKRRTGGGKSIYPDSSP